MLPNTFLARSYLVVLDGPTATFIIRLLPSLVLGNGVKGKLLTSLAILRALGHPDNRRDEFAKEAGDAKEFRPEVVEKVENETFDMRSIVILEVAKFGTYIKMASFIKAPPT